MHELLETYITTQLLSDDVVVQKTDIQTYVIKYKYCYTFDIYIFEDGIRVSIYDYQSEYFKQLFLIQNKLTYKQITSGFSHACSMFLIDFSDPTFAIKTLLLLEDFISSYRPKKLSCSL